MIDSRPTPPSDRLLDLLECWQSLERQGQSVSAADVCTDCPELTEELERLARFARQLETLAADTSAGSTDAPAYMPTLDLPRAESTAAPATAPVDRYTIEDKLGQGGMGTVYRARDRLLERTVALKVIRPEALSSAMRARFEAEARAVALLDHPHIVKVFDVGEAPMPGEPAPVPFLTLEFVEGGSLAKRLGRDTLAPAEAARLIALLARAMQHAHERGIVHRDLKPDNVLLAPASSVAALNTSLGCPRITDFGLARQVATDQRLTSPGAVVGTPSYMAPEQAEGQGDIGPAADVWALGVMLYRLLTGALPFASPSMVDLLHQICRQEPAPPGQLRPGVPAELATIIRDCLRKLPEDRPTAGRLAERLERFLQRDGAEAVSEPTTVEEVPAAGRHPRRRWLQVGALAAVAGAVILGGLTWALWPNRKTEEELVGQAILPAGQTGKSAPAEKPLRIQPLQVTLYQTKGGAAVAGGRIGQQSFAAHHGDAVTLTVDLSAEAYFYLIAFNFDGKEQLLWPVDEQGQPSDQVAPPGRQRLRYPAGENRVYLDDPANSGLQVYAVAASRQPLPPYAEWRGQRQGVSWKALPAGKTVWEADSTATYAVIPGLGADRGSIKEAAGVPPLTRLCRGLRGGGVEVVEAFAFPVLAKEGK